MSKVAEALPKNDTYVKDWDFQQGQLKVTLASASDISSSVLINALQSAGPFKEVSALPSPNTKTAVLQMQVGGL
jgi:hypothetical protein